MAVRKQYQKLAKKAGITDRIQVIINKVLAKEDLSFVYEQIPQSQILGHLPLSRQRQQARRRSTTIFSYAHKDLEEHIDIDSLLQHSVSGENRIHTLLEAHRHYASQAYVRRRIGDGLQHIDHNFTYPATSS